MKNMNPALLALFATNQEFEQFDLYTFKLASGLLLRYAACPFDVAFGGTTWYCARTSGIIIDEQGDSGPRGSWTSDFSVGSWSVVVMPRPTDLIGSTPWLWAVTAGILDEATVRVDRGYILNWPHPSVLTLAPIGILNIFFGRAGEVDFGRSSVTINMNDMRELLITDMPRNLYSAPCRYALFGPGCTLSKAAAAVPTIIRGSTGNQIITTNATQADDTFTLGSLMFTSGLNKGLEIMVRSQKQMNGTLSMLSPFPFEVEVGDTANLYPGCNKTQQRCKEFGNLINFGGSPYIPAPETAM